MSRIIPLLAVLMAFSCEQDREAASNPVPPTSVKEAAPTPAAARPLLAASKSEPGTRDANLQPKMPTLNDDGCPPGSHFIEADALSTTCMSDNSPSARIVVIRSSDATSTGMTILVLSAEEDASYGYHDGYITSRKVCAGQGKAKCVETAYGEKGVRLYEAIIVDGAGIYMTQFHPNGTKASEGPLRSEGEYGTWTYYDLEGHLTRKEEHTGEAEASAR